MVLLILVRNVMMLELMLLDLTLADLTANFLNVVMVLLIICMENSVIKEVATHSL